MYITLFELTSYALPGWLLLMFLPKWRITRWVAESAVFPVYLAVLYVVGIVALLSDLGPGMIQDFGNAAGVTRLLARQDVALVAWIHILTFDQAVGLYIYRDNMRHRYVPLVVQSVLLFLTFMFGPVGFLAYYLARQARRRLHPMDQVYNTEDDTTTVKSSHTGRTASVLGLFAEARPLLWLGITGLVLAGACALVMAVRGPVIPPEGELMKAITFDAGIGIYVLALAVLVPLAGFSTKGRRHWLGWMIVLAVGAYGIETTQILRGLDPRFSRYGSPADE
ncbi:MAG: ABA4-like family protein, partial [Gemmatimonadaceae bacterium]